MQQVMLFENKEFGEIRTLMIDGQPYFVGKDVAEILGYAEPRSAVSKKVDDEDRGVAKMETPSGVQEMTIINESGLYSLILSSKLETAKKFKRWVTSEILPSIRQTGNYISGTSPYSIEDIVRETICQVVPIIIKELEDRTEREKQAEKEIEKLEIKVRRKIERLICAGNHSYSSIARILTMDGIEISPATVCFYAESMGIAD
ncbi:MAG: Bro-N domain-containing protein [Firmicutes bacterium]|nr:Bro-N domain-containing protein [Bacillota bacterium]